jgi:citrate synthase
MEGVIAGNTLLSFIDGAQGRLAYRGIAIEALAEQATFEECVYLLWYDALPDAKQLADFRKDLAEKREVPSEVWEVLKPLAGKQSLMDLVRTGVSSLSAWDKDTQVTLDDPAAHMSANLRMSKRLTAQMGTLVAGCFRLAGGKAPIAPRKELSHAGNFLYLISGEEPGQYEERIFDAALTMHADHGFNASTFSARVTAATESDIYAAVTVAVGIVAGQFPPGSNPPKVHVQAGTNVGHQGNVPAR